MNGVDLATVKEQLGHKSIEMILRYSHLVPAQKCFAVKLLTTGKVDINLTQERIVKT